LALNPLRVLAWYEVFALNPLPVLAWYAAALSRL
jgi:hypothetical protein